jgi:hypothetical protein
MTRVARAENSLGQDHRPTVRLHVHPTVRLHVHQLTREVRVAR